MKLLQAVLFFGARTSRPNSQGVLFSTDLFDPIAIVSEACYNQNHQIDGDWTRQCVTADECCSKRISKSAKRYIPPAERNKKKVEYIFACGCVPSGQPIEGKDARHCCSGVADEKDDKKCGCLSPNRGPQANESMRLFPLRKTDCCHQTPTVRDDGRAARKGEFEGYSKEHFMKCGPGPCGGPGTNPGKDGKCCGGAKPNFTFTGGKVCGCIPAGTRVYPELEKVDESMCCSGRYASSEAKIKTCGCIPGGQELPGLGAAKSDCCNGGLAKGTQICFNNKCLDPHKQKDKKNGDVCCTNKEFQLEGKAPSELQDGNGKVTTGKNNFCGCIKGGTKIAKNKADWCCSRTRDDDGKCTWLSFQDEINTEYMTEDECFSGKASSDGLGRSICQCMRPDSDKRGDLIPDLRSECCSGRLNSKKRCSCIPSRGNLRDGSEKEDCCTGVVEPDNNKICKCGPVGFPFSESRKALGMRPEHDCCSSEQRNGFCACKPAGKGSKTPFCCGGHNVTTGACECLPAGALVTAGNSAKDVCCSKKSKDIEDERKKDCKVKVCDKA